MATINCLCQIQPCRTKGNKISNSWIIVVRKRLTHENTCIPREDKVKVYAPILIGICKAYFQSEINEMEENQNDKTTQVYENENENETTTIDMYDSDSDRCEFNTHTRHIVPSYHGMEHEETFEESRVAGCGPWIVWNNKTKQFNRPIEFKGYWILKFPKDYWDGI